jgi:4-amino-4-deoxy-L-arabinose transferase-like glycosyltransferase
MGEILQRAKHFEFSVRQFADMDWLRKNYPFLIVLSIAFLLRFVNLGYSDFQGDEVRAMLIPGPGQTIPQFLTDQRKGPMQWVVTGAIRLIDPAYTHRFVDRFPFALAGFLAVYFFYKLIEDNFSPKIALYASLFFATNGIFVAFSRIMQYQSLVILFMILALYLFSLSSKSERWKVKGLYIGFIFWALSILSHFDGVLIAPFALYFLIPRLKDKHLWLSMIIPGLMLAAFYIPFVIYLGDLTRSYWEARLQGIVGKVSDSRYLFYMYQPVYVLRIYTLLAAIGLLKLIVDAVFQRKIEIKHVFVVLWFSFPAVILEIFVSVPGTHIYAYLLPLTIILAFGIVLIEDSIAAVAVKLKIVGLANGMKVFGLALAFAFISLQSYTIFVNHTSEYPWEAEKFLLFNLKKPNWYFDLSLYGFPYYRHWDEIGALVNSTDNNGYYSTNENISIARHYISLENNPKLAGIYIDVANPQNPFAKIIDPRIKSWITVHDPVKIFYDEQGRLVAKIYYLLQADP